MKNLKIVILILLSTFSMSAIAQNIGVYIDVVYLSNGSIIKGVIIEQIPGKTVRIKTNDGSEYVYQESEVVKFTREEKPQTAWSQRDNPLSYMNNYKRKGKGYFFEAEIMRDNLSSGIRLTNGYRFNRFAKLGFAIGGETLMLQNFTGGYYQYQTQRLTANLVFSGDILDKRITPFYQMELGFGFDPNAQFSNFGNLNGQMAGAMFGVRFKTKKRIEYKLGLDARFMNTESYYGENMSPSLGARFGVGF